MDNDKIKGVEYLVSDFANEKFSVEEVKEAEIKAIKAKKYADGCESRLELLKLQYPHVSSDEIKNAEIKAVKARKKAEGMEAKWKLIKLGQPVKKAAKKAPIVPVPYYQGQLSKTAVPILKNLNQNKEVVMQQNIPYIPIPIPSPVQQSDKSHAMMEAAAGLELDPLKNQLFNQESKIGRLEETILHLKNDLARQSEMHQRQAEAARHTQARTEQSMIELINSLKNKPNSNDEVVGFRQELHTFRQEVLSQIGKLQAKKDAEHEYASSFYQQHHKQRSINSTMNNQQYYQDTNNNSNNNTSTLKAELMLEKMKSSSDKADLINDVLREELKALKNQNAMSDAQISDLRFNIGQILGKLDSQNQNQRQQVVASYVPYPSQNQANNVDLTQILIALLQQQNNNQKAAEPVIINAPQAPLQPPPPPQPVQQQPMQPVHQYFYLNDKNFRGSSQANDDRSHYETIKQPVQRAVEPAPQQPAPPAPPPPAPAAQNDDTIDQMLSNMSKRLNFITTTLEN